MLIGLQIIRKNHGIYNKKENSKKRRKWVIIVNGNGGRLKMDHKKKLVWLIVYIPEVDASWFGN